MSRTRSLTKTGRDAGRLKAVQPRLTATRPALS
ncbi:hypothetical protein KPB2_5511 [Klebsiella pneumoniae Kb677]|nr:hypothetical protein KPB2_5511 [Klebsiella pneumoniae Kb677]